MKYSSHIHNRTHLVKSFLGNLESMFSRNAHRKHDLLVLNYHGTQKKYLDSFQRQLDFLQTKYHIISPADIELFFQGKMVHQKPAALLSFDDGLKNNLYASAILKKRGIKSIFFVIPGFIDADAGKQKSYFLKNIRPVINNNIDKCDEDFMALSWEEIIILAKDGNEIGSHSYTHTLETNNNDLQKSEFEVVQSKTRIENTIGSRVRSFCGPNNSLISVGRKEMSLIKKHYDFFFSTIPGTNIGTDRYFIKRSNVEAYWLEGAFKYAIGKLDRLRWQKKSREFSALV